MTIDKGQESLEAPLSVYFDTPRSFWTQSSEREARYSGDSGESGESGESGDGFDVWSQVFLDRQQLSPQGHVPIVN